MKIKLNFKMYCFRHTSTFWLFYYNVFTIVAYSISQIVSSFCTSNILPRGIVPNCHTFFHWTEVLLYSVIVFKRFTKKTSSQNLFIYLFIGLNPSTNKFRFKKINKRTGSSNIWILHWQYCLITRTEFMTFRNQDKPFYPLV